MEGLIEYLADIEVRDSFGRVNAEASIKIAKQKILSRLGKFPFKFSLIPSAIYPLEGMGYRVPVKIRVEEPCFRELCSRLMGIPVYVLNNSKFAKTSSESVRRTKSALGGKQLGKSE